MRKESIFIRRLAIAIMFISLQLVCFLPFTCAEGVSISKGRQWEFTVFSNKVLSSYSTFTVVGQEQWQGQETWVVKGQFTFFDKMLKGFDSEELLRFSLDYRLLYSELTTTFLGNVDTYLIQWNDTKGYVSQYKFAVGTTSEDKTPSSAPVYFIWPENSPFMIEILLSEGLIDYNKPFSVFMTNGIRTVTLIPKEEMELKTPGGTETVTACEIPELKLVVYLSVEQRVVALEDLGEGEISYQGNWGKQVK
ncbi:MAG TPA: hypothetical protein VHY08_09600 [Bacillota bacterium]|nr:hypothetical protein [Bacillota bacterium]